VENQETADYRLDIFDALPIKRRNIIAQPLIERINIERHLSNVVLVVVGGEQDKDARTFEFNWVLNLKAQCDKAGVPLQLRQTGTHFTVNGVPSKKSARDLAAEFGL
jgi:protein gp37